MTLFFHDSMGKRARTEPEVAKQGPMDNAEISKMLGVLMYHSVGPHKADQRWRCGGSEAVP